MQPQDLSRLTSAADPRLDPSGVITAFVVGRPDLENDRYDRAIWVSDANGVRQFTVGPRDSSPRWSPSGIEIAFLRSPADGKPGQVAVMPFAGGEPKVVTDFEFGVEGLEWAPDGSRLVVVAVTPTAEWEDADEDERKRRPREITRIPYHFDNVGWMDDRRRHLWLVDPTGAEEPSCLTPGEFDEASPAWSPDTTRIAFITDRDPARGISPGTDVFEVEVDSGEVTRVGGRGFWAAVSYSPEGVLHLLGANTDEYPSISSLHRREPDGSLTDLTGHLDRNMIPTGNPPFIRWDGGNALVGYEDSGKLGLVTVHPNARVDHLVDDSLIVTGADTANGRTVFTASTWDTPGELWAFESDKAVQLTDLATSDLRLVQPDHFRVGPDEIDTWVFLPEGDGPVPLLLNIHGGPAAQYGFGFFDEFQVYASAGYGVVACNPRGSSGRGLDFVRAVTGDGWGVVDLADIRAVIDAALERHPRLDPGRMGIMGGSYGGFLTSWTIAFEDRWQSAVVERALTNFASFAGTSDIGATFPNMYTKADYPDAWETWWRKSPLAYAHQVKTPTLVLHSDSDFRCPIEQGEQYFTALLRSGTPTKLVRFPGEGHELSRSGKPKHRLERFEAILNWHGEHLGPPAG